MGEAFATAWQRRELIILEMRVQDELVKRGISVHDFRLLFNDLDTDGSGELDWNEFKLALRQLGIHLPVQKMRQVVRACRTVASPPPWHSLGLISPGLELLLTLRTDSAY